MDSTSESSKDSISWNNSLLLNIPIIDNQHKTLFKLFDELILLDKEEDKDNKILPTLIELQRYSIYHFDTEEALMREANWSKLEIHLSQHKLFKNKCNEFIFEYNYGNKVLVEQMVLFLQKWLIIHISEVDANYAETIRYLLTQKNE